jgi:hypothetical protein
MEWFGIRKKPLLTCFESTVIKLPISNYKSKPTSIIPITVTSTLTIPFRLCTTTTLPTDTTQKPIIKNTIEWDRKYKIDGQDSNDFHLDDIITDRLHKYNSDNAYFPISVSLIGVESKLPFDCPFRLTLCYNNSVERHIHHFLIPANIKHNSMKNNILFRTPFEDINVISNYAPTKEDFLSFTPSEDDISMKVDTDSAFYDVLKYHVERDAVITESNNSSWGSKIGFKQNIEDKYKVKLEYDHDPSSRVIDTQIYKRIRMSKQSYGAIKDYFEKTIYNDIKKLDVESSGIMVSIDDIINEEKIASFKKKLMKEFAGSTVREEYQSLTCQFTIKVEMYVMYDELDDSKLGGHAMRFVESKKLG